MRKEVMIAFGACAFVIALLGATVWLANAHMQPPSQPTRLVLPDERIPH